MTTNGKPRLGSWTRIGIAASVLWVLLLMLDVSLFWPLYAVRDARSWSNRIYNVCLDPMKGRIPFTSV